MSPDRPSPIRPAIVPSARAYFLDQAGFAVQFVEDGAEAPREMELTAAGIRIG